MMIALAFSFSFSLAIKEIIEANWNLIRMNSAFTHWQGFWRIGFFENLRANFEILQVVTKKVEILQVKFSIYFFTRKM